MVSMKLYIILVTILTFFLVTFRYIELSTNLVLHPRNPRKLTIGEQCNVGLGNLGFGNVGVGNVGIGNKGVFNSGYRNIGVLNRKSSRTIGVGNILSRRKIGVGTVFGIGLGVPNFYPAGRKK